YHYAWNNRGIVLGKLGRNEKAITSYDQALKFQPDYHQAWYNRRIAVIKLKWQKLTQAVTGFLRLISFRR
ncbi:MAG: tetratricopeptide repeat protein, partial [Nostoc sp.]